MDEKKIEQYKQATQIAEKAKKVPEDNRKAFVMQECRGIDETIELVDKLLAAFEAEEKSTANENPAVQFLLK